MEEIDKSNNNNSNNSNNNPYNNINLNEKPLHGNQIYNSINLAASTNPMNNEKNNNLSSNLTNNIYTFLQPNGKSYTFRNGNCDDVQSLYQNFQSQCKFAICILIKDDTYFNGKLLEETFKGINDNMKELENLLIKPENVLICVFFNEIKNNLIFSEEDVNSLQDNEDYVLAQKAFFYQEQVMNVHCISKRDYLSDIGILKFYYTFIINNLRINNNSIFSSILTAGVIPYSNTFLNLIELSFHQKNVHSIIVPSLEDDKSANLFFKIKKYERIHFNLYNMNFYNMSASVPISSLLNTMTIDNKLYQDLSTYYIDINLNQNLDYHDYNLSLYLFSKNYNIIYYNIVPMGHIKYSDLHEDPICD